MRTHRHRAILPSGPVAQFFNLLYRRVALGWALEVPHAPDDPQLCGLPIRDTAECNSALRGLPAWCLLGLSLLASSGASAQLAEVTTRGGEVVVVYNTAMAASKDVAEHYAGRRGVPTNQVIGLDLPIVEAISRKDYVERLQQPLFKRLEEAGVLVYSPATNRVPDRPEIPPFRGTIGAKARYLALCYGVPVKILSDPTLAEPGTEKAPAELRSTGAAVDSQLTLLPVTEAPVPWTGPMRNPFSLATNVALMHPTNGLFMVTRLDGPTPAMARALVDRAIEAETNGLWGRAYFDLRGLTNGAYKPGDDMMGLSALAASRYGFETVLDEKPETFSAGFPMSQAALYMGWYDQHVSPLFTHGSVEFMPGAFAYHLYSFSAQTLRTSNDMWVGQLLARGATCTIGAVEEPYLGGTPDLFAFLSRWLSGWTFGEASMASLGSVSWQMTVVGDPLYRPFGRDAASRLPELEQRKSPMLEWAHLLAINRLRTNAHNGPAVLLDALDSTRLPLMRQSAVLTEKAADMHWATKGMSDAIEAYEIALRRGPSPAQRQRLLLTLAERRTLYGPNDKALGWYETLLKEFPDYPEVLRIYQQMLPLARKLNRVETVERCEREIRRLSPTPPPTTTPGAPKA